MVSKSWTFTLNDGEPISFDETSMEYLVYQKEQGEETKHEHYQGYVRFKTNKRLTGVKKIHQTAHWEIAKGSPEQNKNYCTKDETRIDGPWEFGIFPQQGKRNDLTEIIDMVKQKRPREDYAFTPAYVKYYRGIEAIRLIATTPYEHNDVRGEWYYGESGTGKSRKAFEENPLAYRKAQNKWFDGYDNQEVIIIDDLDTDALGHYLKIWADRYPCTGETKGGTIQLVHKKIIITSNFSISELFSNNQKMIDPLLRRFKCILFNKL